MKEKQNDKKTKLLAETKYYDLRDDITALMMNDFGFSEDKYEKQIKRFEEMLKDNPRKDDIVAKMRHKKERFYEKFISREADAVLDMLRKIQIDFTEGNSIYPDDQNGTQQLFMEFCERRRHMDGCIAGCHALKQEIQYIIRVLPVDINRFETYGKRIDEQIALYKGIRTADNRFIRKYKKRPPKGGDT